MWKYFFAAKKNTPQGWSVIDSVLLLTATTQRKCCGWMNRKASHWTPGQTKVYLALFCMCFIGASIFILWDSFSKTPQPDTEHPGNISVLPILPQTPEVVLTEKDISSIMDFSNYLDSLQKTPKGRQQFMELARDRPGLIDSLATIQRYLFK